MTSVTFHVVPPAGQTFQLFSEISWHLRGWIGTKVYTNIGVHGPQRTSSTDGLPANGPLGTDPSALQQDMQTERDSQQLQICGFTKYFRKYFQKPLKEAEPWTPEKFYCETDSQANLVNRYLNIVQDFKKSLNVLSLSPDGGTFAGPDWWFWLMCVLFPGCAVWLWRGWWFWRSWTESSTPSSSLLKSR